jgi:Zn-dependent M28 family amino/carboxypeptidase
MNFPLIYADFYADIADNTSLKWDYLRKSAIHLRKSARNFYMFLLIFSTLFIHAPLLRAQDTLSMHYSRTITQQELSEHVYKLASDEFEGRYTGSKGLKKAEEYIVNEFKEDGLEEPVICGRPAYTQDFTLENCRWKDQRLMVNGIEFKVGRDFLFLSDPVDIKGTYPVVFAGFGIEDSVYSDFGNIDIKGKIMLVFSGEPRNEEGISFISGKKELSKKGYYFSKAAMAANKGAEGVIIIARRQSDFKKYLEAREYYDPGPSISYPFFSENEKVHKESFAAFMDIKTAARLVNKKPGDLASAMQEMESSLKTTAGRYTGTVTIDASSDCFPLQAANVVGIIEGTDLKHEAVVVVAHYDHLGIKQGQVYHGADDNASGTAAMMEIAEAFATAARSGNRPRRTIIFLAATAEELGLYGSKHYSLNPLIPLDSTYACVNIDMIGRANTSRGDSTDYISGYAYLSRDLLEVARANDLLAAPGLEDRIEFRAHNRGGSDHYYFASHGIPSLFYFAGFHKDYHEPTDTANKILYARMEKIVRAIFATTWELANREEKLEIGK